MRNKNKAKIGKYLPIALIAMLLVPMSNNVVAEGDSYYGLMLPPIPNGMVVTMNHQNYTNPGDYGFIDPDGFNDGFQWRQSLFLALRPCYNTTVSRLKGYTVDFVIYCPIIPIPHSLSFLGNVTYVFEDGSTETRSPAGFTFTWTSEGIQMPLIIVWSCTTSWIYLTCKNIYVSLDYCEDGQFIRHIERSFVNRPNGESQLLSSSLIRANMASQVVI